MNLKLKKYDPLKAGSIDGTDTIPHDRAIWRAMNSCYDPPNQSMSKHTLFVAHLLHSVTEEDLRRKFSRIGEVKSCKLIRDIVTGESKGYGFIEYVKEKDALYAYHEMNGVDIHGRSIIVDWRISNSLPGWIPRRLGGGWGGKKESGQLRFGCRDRPWHRPIIIPSVHKPEEKKYDTDYKYKSKSHRPRYQ
ncbi:UNVERIFIED_CONTAM: hypothetical protein RMT77_012125 [Armadillidium vulgare]